MRAILAVPLWLIPLVVALGCATAERNEAKLQAWVGQPVDNLIVSLGPPSSSAELPNGDTELSWSRPFVLSSPPQVESKGGATLGHVSYSQPVDKTTTYSCDTRAIVNDSGLIVSLQQEGDGCRSS